MRILMVNKFLYPNGGSETYMFKLGDKLAECGHQVEYFGMEHEGRCVSNNVGAYTQDMDFHNSGALKKLQLSLKTIYSKEARQKIRLVLDDFKPNVIHLNNFNYQLTPSIILEIRKWEKQTGNKVSIVYTAHDFQLVCPSHNFFNNGHICENCVGGKFSNCIKNRCVHGSMLKSVIGAAEAYYWNCNKVYEQLDTIICCSKLMKSKLDTNPILREKTIALHNFIEAVEVKDVEKENYVLYFGRLSEDKGVRTILNCSNTEFVVAGTGPLEDDVKKKANINYVGFKSGEELAMLISKAKVTVCPSIVHDNCPFSVMESIMYGTPVVASRIGGIPELVQEGRTGLLVEAGNSDALESAIKNIMENDDKAKAMSKACLEYKFDTVDEYCDKLINIYSADS